MQTKLRPIALDVSLGKDAQCGQSDMSPLPIGTEYPQFEMNSYESVSQSPLLPIMPLPKLKVPQIKTERPKERIDEEYIEQAGEPWSQTESQNPLEIANLVG